MNKNAKWIKSNESIGEISPDFRKSVKLSGKVKKAEACVTSYGVYDFFVNGKKVPIKTPADAVKAGIGYLSEDRKRFGLCLQLSVAHNTALPSLDELSECIGTDADREQSASELRELLSSYLASLEPRRRQMFVCRYYYSDTVEDIARALSVGPSYVYRELSATRRALKDYLAERGYNV